MKRNRFLMLFLALVAHQSSQVQAMGRVTDVVLNARKVGNLNKVKMGITKSADAVQDFFNAQYIKMQKIHTKWKQTITDDSLGKLRTKETELQETVRQLRFDTASWSDRQKTIEKLAELKTAEADLEKVTAEILDLKIIQIQRNEKIDGFVAQLSKLAEKKTDVLGTKIIDNAYKLPKKPSNDAFATAHLESFAGHDGGGRYYF